MTTPTELLGRIAADPADPTDGAARTVTFDRLYRTSPADLWEACTDPDRLARWFAPVSGDLEEGGTFVIHFDDDDTPRCRVTACTAPTGFTWEWPQADAMSVVTVEVAPDPAGARLRLRHTGLGPAQAIGYAAGWDTYVRRLEAWLSGVAVPDWDETWEALHALYAAAGDAVGADGADGADGGADAGVDGGSRAAAKRA